jgi:hypothetical protein
LLRIVGVSVGYEPKPAVGPHCDVVVEPMAKCRTYSREEVCSLMGDAGNVDHTPETIQINTVELIGTFMTIEQFVQAVEHCTDDSSEISEESYEVGRSVAHLPD